MKESKAEWKAKEIERRVNNEKNKCKHFNGIQHSECKVGVNYRSLIGGPDHGWAARLPCLRDDESTIVCELLSLPTEGEARQTVETRDKRMTEILSQLGNGICPQCKVEVQQRQVGHCVYGTCGHRLYQGTVNPKFAVART